MHFYVHLVPAVNNTVNVKALRFYYFIIAVIFSRLIFMLYYVREAIEKFFRAMVINGKSGNAFNPTGEAARVEVVAMLTKFTQYKLMPNYLTNYVGEMSRN
jgi:hypothetical protein